MTKMTKVPFSRRDLLKTTVIGAIGGATLSNVTAAGSVVAKEDLIAWWALTDGTSDAIGEHDASADKGNPTPGTYSGRDGVAFTGDDGLRVSRGGNKTLNRAGRDTGPTSFCMWVYFDEAAPGSDNAHTLWRDDTGYVIRGRPLDDSSGVQVQFNVTEWGNTPANGYTTPDDIDATIPVQGWHHLSIIVEPESDLTIYVDGKERFYDGSMGGYNEPSNEFWTDMTIGAQYGWDPERWGNTLQGKIADLRIYDARLSAEEVDQIYTNTSHEEQKEDATFSINSLSTSSPIVAGSPLEVHATVENIGDLQGTQTVVLESIDGTQVDSQSVTLSGGETTTIALLWETREIDASEGNITVRTGEYKATETVLIEQNQNEDEETGQEGNDSKESDKSGNSLAASFTYTPERPSVDQQVAFDASSSTASENEIKRYSWKFESDETATGKQTTHTFDRSGGYNVTLTIVDSQGKSDEMTKQISVTDDSTSLDSMPGFGAGSAITALGGVAYMLKRRLPSR